MARRTGAANFQARVRVTADYVARQRLRVIAVAGQAFPAAKFLVLHANSDMIGGPRRRRK
jgi:hypothetical protein